MTPPNVKRIAFETASVSDLSRESFALSRKSSRTRVGCMRRNLAQRTMFAREALPQVELAESVFDTVWLRSSQSALYRAFLKEVVMRNVRVATANGWPPSALSVAEAVAALASDIQTSAAVSIPPAWIFVACSEILDPNEVLDEVSGCFPATKNVHCVTSCRGVTSNAGFKATQLVENMDRPALSMLCVFDPLGCYLTLGVLPCFPSARAPFENQLDQAYFDLRAGALEVLLDRQNNGKERPAPEPLAEHLVIWLSGVPGTEEAIVDALFEWGHSRFGRTVPVVGGTAADTEIKGKWRTFWRQADGVRGVYGQDDGDGAVITLIAASVKVFQLFAHPFTPLTEQTAKVLACGSGGEPNGEASGRVIQTLRDGDGKEWPAGTLYHKWCVEHVGKKVMPEPVAAEGPNDHNKAVLAASSLCPLGVLVGRDGDDASDYRMLHPSGLYHFERRPEGEDAAYLKAFASVEPGKSDVVLFTARRGDLLHRVTKLKEQLEQQLARSNNGPADAALCAPSDDLHKHIRGVLMVYCAGCMMKVNQGHDGGEQMRRLTKSLADCFAGRPFLAYHPFGEQGYFPSRQVNHHTNLMFSALVFSSEPCFEVDETRTFSEVLTPILSSLGAQDPHQVVMPLLKALLVRGERAPFDRLAAVIRCGAVSPDLLKDLAPCSSRPLLFALRCAEMFHLMAGWYPLKATEYMKHSAWFQEFSADLVNAAPLALLNEAGVLDDASICLATLMAVNIDCKGVVATPVFQDVLDQMWRIDPDPRHATHNLLFDSAGPRKSRCSFPPRLRHYLNLGSYLCMTALQAYVSSQDRDNTGLWGLLLLWSASHLVQKLASPIVRLVSAPMAINLALVATHAHIWCKTMLGREVPRDSDAVGMLCHFWNILQDLVVHSQLGPHIITLLTMMADIEKMLYLIAFFAFCFYCSFRALYHSVEGVYIGEDWLNPSTLLLNVVWGPQVMWSNSIEGSERTLLLSDLFGLADSYAIDLAGGAIVGLAVLTIPIVLLNMLIAIMAASYNSVSTDADAEFKRSFAVRVLFARELCVLPKPLSLFHDMYRLAHKLAKRIRGGWEASSVSLVFTTSFGGMDYFLSCGAKHQLAVSQLAAAWEAQARLHRLQTGATANQMGLLRDQTDGLQDKISVLYASSMRVAEKLDRLEASLILDRTGRWSEAGLAHDPARQNQGCSDRLVAKGAPGRRG